MGIEKIVKSRPKSRLAEKDSSNNNYKLKKSNQKIISLFGSKAGNIDLKYILFALIPIVLILLVAVIYLMFRTDFAKVVLSNGDDIQTTQEANIEPITETEETTIKTTKEPTTQQVTTTLPPLIPQTQPQAPPTVSTRYYIVRTNGSSLMIRSYPSTAGNIVGRLPNDTIVPVSSYYGNWAYVTYNGISGWSSLEFMELYYY